MKMLPNAFHGIVIKSFNREIEKSFKPGKTVLDATNPISAEAPEDGVLKFFTNANNSLMESLQKQFKDVRFVKAFSCIGSPFMYKPTFSDGRPTMFIAGDDNAAKKEVTEIVELFGFEAADMGTAKGARAIEPLCMLWCIPGIPGNSWNHAFKLLRK
ncbi:MAG: hypothetical protein GVY19_04255 [Bacteroidetes bacterium]|jgi:predicted dinucleotide-binding enzyme|nr:hypothetical protein [Bacteroidota bacterium]